MTMYAPFIHALPVFPGAFQDEKNVCFGLRTKVASSGEYRLTVATSCFYRVFVNGEFVHYGPARAGHGVFRADELPLTLKQGDYVTLDFNYAHVNGFGNIDQPGFFQAELTENGSVIAATGKNGFEAFHLTERVRRSCRYSFQRSFTENYRLTSAYDGWRVGKDGKNAVPVKTDVTEKKNIIPRGIPYNTFPVSYAVRKEASGRFSFGDELTRPLWIDRCYQNAGTEFIGGFPIEALEWDIPRDYCRMAFTDIKKDAADFGGTLKLADGEFAVLSLASEKTGLLAFDLTTDGGSLYVGHEEIADENGDINALRVDCCNLFRLDAEKGAHRFICMEPKGFKFMKFIACGRFTLSNIRLYEYICPVPITREYTGHDDALSLIFSSARASFEQCSSDIFMDCPTRERAGWLCDSFFLGRSEHFFTGKNLIEHNFLENFLHTDNYPSIERGMLPMCYPSDHYDGVFIPNWAMWFVVELKEHYDRTRDRAFIDRFKDKVYALLDWFKAHENADGLLEKLPSWVFVEWSKANDLVQDINFPSNMMYVLALRSAGALYEDKRLLEKADALTKVIRARSFDGTFFTDNEIYRDGRPVLSGERTETCQYYAFFTGIATKELYPDLWNTLLCDFGPDRASTGKYPEIYPSNAFIGNYLRLLLLDENGLYDKLHDEIRGYLYYMAVRTGTLWENITTCASCNHGFTSYAAKYIADYESHRNEKGENL